MKSAIKKLVIRILPLSLRKVLACRINKSTWLRSGDRAYWATELLADFAAADVNAYHKFLWRHHLAYAETYEADLRFGYENFNETRRAFFAELPAVIANAGVGGPEYFRSVLEVGCSLGYLLRYMETDVFRNAGDLHGIDIDTYAIEEGKRRLAADGSNVRLYQGDMESMPPEIAGRDYDFILGSGVLLYLDEESAGKFVADLLRRTRRLLSITALAHPGIDNRELENSVPRDRDGTWIHNVDRMIERAGGRIISRRCESGRLIDGNTIYFLHAVPSGSDRVGN